MLSLDSSADNFVIIGWVVWVREKVFNQKQPSLTFFACLKESNQRKGILCAFAPYGSLRKLEFFAPQKLSLLWPRRAVRKLALTLLELQTCEPPAQKFCASQLKGAMGLNWD